MRPRAHAGPSAIGALVVAASVSLLLPSGCGTRRDVETPAPPRERAVPVPPPAAPEARQPGETAAGVHHRVGKGQTLWRIARAYGVALDELADVNGIEDPAAIETGALLFVPGARQLLDVAPHTGADPGSALSVRLLWPVADGRVISGFGAPRPGRRHKGVDIGGRAGQPVFAAAAGRVVYSGSTMRGYGKTVVIYHGNGLRSLYAHGSKLLVRPGERVRRGQRIALVGRTGNASTDHCHFEVRRGGVPVDPLPYLEGASR